MNETTLSRSSLALFVLAALVLVGCGTARQTTVSSRETLQQPQPDAAQTCRANLRSIDGAKRVWALEHRKMNSAVPTDADLFGPTTYIREKPKCPSGGSYTLRAVNDHPLCSIPEHVY